MSIQTNAENSQGREYVITWRSSDRKCSVSPTVDYIHSDVYLYSSEKNMIATKQMRIEN